MVDVGQVPSCAHQFARVRRWPIKRRWMCQTCLMITRAYDGADRMAWRPIHPHMSVALRGYNTTTKQ